MRASSPHKFLILAAGVATVCTLCLAMTAGYLEPFRTAVVLANDKMTEHVRMAAADLVPPGALAATPPSDTPSASPEHVLAAPSDGRMMTLSFDDEFTDPEHSFGRNALWTPSFGSGRDPLNAHSNTANGEKEIYVDPGFAGSSGVPLGLNPFRFHDGLLTITADHTPKFAVAALWGRPYTSGMLSTANTWSQTYGYFEIRARLPRGRGLWPAFWLLPADGSWPPELDVFEVLGHRPNLVFVSTHTRASGDHTFATQQITAPDSSTGFHRYGALWDAQGVKWFIDRRLVATGPTPGDLNRPMYLVVNLAVGGYWPGDPDAATRLPAHMDVDYVRAWRFSDTAKRP